MKNIVFLLLISPFCLAQSLLTKIDYKTDLLESLYSDSNWVLIESTSDSILISKKQLKKKDLIAIKIKKTFLVEPYHFTDIIMNINDYSSLLSNSNLIQTKLIESNKNSLIGYQNLIVNFPFIKNREYFFYMSQQTFNNNYENIMCFWVLLNPDRFKNNLTLSKENIYLKHGAGIWKWDKSDLSNGYDISYILTMHPGGNLPDIIIDMINKTGIKGLFSDVQKKVYSIQ